MQVGSWTNHRGLELDRNRIYFLDGVNYILDSGSFISGKNVTVTTLLVNLLNVVAMQRI